jgi:hypothetical protein
MKQEDPMKFNRSGLLTITVFGLIALALSSYPASAQAPAFNGSFSLTHEVRWQGTTLPAGDYTISIESLTLPVLIKASGPNGGFFLMASAKSERHAEQGNVLVLEQRGSTSFISELYLADYDLHVRYSVPTAPNEKLLAERTDTIAVRKASSGK